MVNYAYRRINSTCCVGVQVIVRTLLPTGDWNASVCVPQRCVCGTHRLQCEHTRSNERIVLFLIHNNTRRVVEQRKSWGVSVCRYVCASRWHVRNRYIGFFYLLQHSSTAELTTDGICCVFSVHFGAMKANSRDFHKWRTWCVQWWSDFNAGAYR